MDSVGSFARRHSFVDKIVCLPRNRFSYDTETHHTSGESKSRLVLVGEDWQDSALAGPCRNCNGRRCLQNKVGDWSLVPEE